ncbi:hypothetical protein [Desulfolithobacter sp.]
MAAQSDVPKILVVGGKAFSDALTAYALKMAQKLDLEIIALNVDEDILDLSEDEQAAAREAFFEAAEQSAADLAEKAESMDIKLTSMVVVNRIQTTIEHILNQECGVRYILSEPASDRSEHHGDRVQNPVLQLVGPETHHIDPVSVRDEGER